MDWKSKDWHMQEAFSRNGPRSLHVWSAGILLCVTGWLALFNPEFFCFRNLDFPIQVSASGHGFYANITRPRNVCPGIRGDASSYAGYIGLEEDRESEPRRSFFWSLNYD